MSMQIFVKAVGGETLVLNTCASQSVSVVKAQAGGEGHQLVFAGQVLEDNASLGACGVQDESTLFMSGDLLGGGDGTPAMGKRHKHTHGLCPRCGKRSFHHQKKTCASCGYPAAKIRSYEWAMKAKRRRAPGTGRMSYLKTIPRRFKNGFREGTTAPARRKGKK